MKSMLKCYKDSFSKTNCDSIGLLILRVVIGACFISHGWMKIQSPFSWMGPDAPVPGFFQFLAALAEFGGGMAWIIGLLFPLASFGLMCTMIVAAHFHMNVMGDPFQKYELAVVFLTISILFLFTGPGRHSLDRILLKK